MYAPARAQTQADYDAAIHSLFTGLDKVSYAVLHLGIVSRLGRFHVHVTTHSIYLRSLKIASRKWHCTASNVYIFFHNQDMIIILENIALLYITGMNVVVRNDFHTGLKSCLSPPHLRNNF